MAGSKQPLITAEFANSIHAKRLPVFPGLVLTCFVRDNVSVNRGPLFVVREIDVKIIRNKNAGVSRVSSSGTSGNTVSGGNNNGTTVGSKSSTTSSFLTEQAIRASVRQAVLNMNLALEPASKHEIQFLKHIGVLGKRAPSCSLLDGNDMALLLEAFGRSYASSELRNAVSKITRTGDMATLMPARLDGTDDITGSIIDVSCTVTDKSNSVDHNDTAGSSGPLPELKRQLIRKRKLQRLLSDSSNYGTDASKRIGNHHRSRAMSDSNVNVREPTNVVAGTTAGSDELSDSSSTSSGSSNGLDTLLSALSSPTSNRTTIIQQQQHVSQSATVNNTNSAALTAQYTMHNPLTQRPLLSRHLSGSLTLSPTATLPILPQFAGVASMYGQRDQQYSPQYYTSTSPVVTAERLSPQSMTPPACSTNTGSNAIPVQSRAAESAPRPAPNTPIAATEKQISPFESTQPKNSSVVPTDNTISPSQSFDGLDAMSSTARSAYMSQANQAERVQPAAEIEQF